MRSKSSAVGSKPHVWGCDTPLCVQRSDGVVAEALAPLGGSEGEGEAGGEEELDRDHALQVGDGAAGARPDGDGAFVSEEHELIHLGKVLGGVGLGGVGGLEWGQLGTVAWRGFGLG